ncbi:MAG: hypothetical protein J6V80_00120, partial [Clostridia bacterium]|nr:hypothetical protein [Clostridia bacterium]
MRNKKIVAAVILACILIMSMTVIVFAESADGAAQKSYWSDPQFYKFIFVVVAIISAVICSAMIYSAIRNSKVEREWKDDVEGTAQLYVDLDDAKWDAPDTVFLETLEPPAAILSELEPVKTLKGLDGFVITEKPINPVTAANIGADPFAYGADDNVNNTVFEAVANNPISMGELDSTFQSYETHLNDDDVDPAAPPQTSPFAYIATNATPTTGVFVPPAATITEERYQPTTLVDSPVTEAAPPQVGRVAPGVPLSDPISFIQNVPITIYTSGDEDGTVQISASIFENTANTVILSADLASPAPAPVAEPIAEAAPASPSIPFAFMAAAAEEPVEIPETKASIFEGSIFASQLVDEQMPFVPQPILIPEAITPAASAIAHTTVAEETPVVIPTTEANIYENNIAAIQLVDEQMPFVPQPILIPEAITPAASAIAHTTVAEETPVVIPTVEANIYENNIAASQLVDEQMPFVAEPVVIPEAITPAASAIAHTVVADEEPVVIPTTEANIFENNIAASQLADEQIPFVAEPIIIPEAITPAASAIAHTTVAEETPVVIPTTEANIFEDAAEAVTLADEQIPFVAEPIVVAEAITPAASAISHSVVADEEPVVVPTTEANIFENN